jgi:hypothetical protein
MQLDSSSFKLQWKAPDGLPLHYLMRVEQGKGPLALALKNFRLPGQVFLTGKAIVMQKNTGTTQMSELLQQLTRCFSDRDATTVAQEQRLHWQSWLLPVTGIRRWSEDPCYHDVFLLMRDEMNKSPRRG